ncbi:MAG: hypothetical protein KDK34_13895, partial [Leptospiraceae bacterium]|nr:hypothetical protein [Leptospiraceae bacterium]
MAKKVRARSLLQLVLPAFVCSLVIISSNITAETVQLRNGETVSGRIVSQDRQRIVLRNSDGVQVISKSNV